MNRHWNIAVLCALLLIGSVIVVSCYGTRPEQMSLTDLLREGRKSLENNDAGEAYNLFREAREIAPDHPAALWGTVLSNNLLIWRNLTGIIQLLSGAYVYQPSREQCETGCARLATCGFFDDFRTTAHDCIANCPWKLQPFMFQEVLSAPTCYDIRYGAAEWIIRTTPENCKLLCESLDRCGLIIPGTTYDVPGCIDNCPLMYVEKHSECYLKAHLNECHRYDRTCFEHTVNGLQILLGKLGAVRVPETIEFADKLLDRPDDYQYYLRYYKWMLEQPALTIDMPGRFSKPELHLSKALGYFWQFVIQFVESQNLDINTVTFDQFTFNGSLCKIMLNDFLHSIKNTLFDPIFPNAGALHEPHAQSMEYEKAAGESLGHLFGEVARMFESMLGSTDKQVNKSLGYTDTNVNFRWDDDEVWTMWDTGYTFTKQDVIAFQILCKALEANFLNEEPVPVDLFKPIITAAGYSEFQFVIDLIENVTGVTEVNPSYPFKHPSPDGIRPAVMQFVNVLEYLQEHASELPASLGCTQ